MRCCIVTTILQRVAALLLIVCIAPAVAATLPAGFTGLGAFNDLPSTWAWFNPTFASSAANSCLVYYERARLTLFLLNDAATAWTRGTMTNAG